MSARRPRLAETYRFVDVVGDYPTIDGQMFPWFVSDRGPLVEELDRGTHILWVPVVVAAPMPTPPAGTPDAEPLLAAEPAAVGGYVCRHGHYASEHWCDDHADHAAEDWQPDPDSTSLIERLAARPMPDDPDGDGVVTYEHDREAHR